MKVIHSLYDLYELGGRDRMFAADYSGSYNPPRLPHERDWDIANEHWLEAVNAYLASTKANSGIHLDSLVRIAEEYIRGMLWWKAVAGECYACPARSDGR